MAITKRDESGRIMKGNTQDDPRCLANLRPQKKGLVSDETRQKISQANYQRFINEEDHPRWTGDAVSYRALHKWVEKHLGKPHFCEDCKRTDLRHRQYHWSNVSGTYQRDVSDWRRLCVKCHIKRDKSQ